MPPDPYQRQVKEVMAKDVVAVHAQVTVHEALEMMMENQVSMLPVVNANERCVGIFSSTDVLSLATELEEELEDLDRGGDVSISWLCERIIEHGMGNQKVSEVMTDTVLDIGPEASLAATAGEMLRNRVHRLPVVGNKGQLLGIVSTMDILAAFVEGAPEQPR